MGNLPKWPLVVAALVIAWGLLALFGPDGDDDEGPDLPPAEGTTSVSDAAAWDACKDAVEEQVQNPATIDYALTSVQTTETPDGFDIAGSATAENAFGVKQALAFSCEVTSNGMATAEVVAAQ